MDFVPKCPITALTVGDVLKGQDGKKYIVCKKANTMYWEPYEESDVMNMTNNTPTPSAPYLISNERRETQTCTICLEDILNENTTSYLPCCHGFHQQCFQIYANHKNQTKKNISCPNCREEHYTYGQNDYKSIINGLGL